MGSIEGANSADVQVDACSETSPLMLGKARGGVGKPAGGKLTAVALAQPFELFGLGPWMANLGHHFGHELLVMLFASQHLMKGFVAAFTGSATQFLFASYKVQGPRMQIFGGVTSLPWAMKPIIGLLSDCFPIAGYNKAPYIIGASVFGVAACAALGAAHQGAMTIEMVVVCLFLMQLQFSTCDLLTEAKYAEKMQAKPDQGPALMTYVWFGLQTAGLLATVFVGPVMQHLGPKAPYMIALPFAAFIILPVCSNYMQETRSSPEEVQAARAKLMEQKEACMLCVLMFAGTIVLSVVGIRYESASVNCFAAIAVAVVMLVAFSLVLRPVIAKVNAFFLLQTSMGFSIGGASFYFFTDAKEMYPEGPHFSMEFYTSVLGVVGSLCSLVGIYSYQRFMKDWTYRNLLLMTNVVLSVLSILDMMLFSRMNIRLGIPDHAFVLGSSVLQGVVGQWMWMPGVVILSQLCPKGMEATMYALLAGCHNLGNTIASNSGALVLEMLGCNPSGEANESAAFKNLWVGSLLSTIFPMFTLLLLPWLIPDARQTDKLLDDEDRDATTGSLWRRWRGTAHAPEVQAAP